MIYDYRAKRHIEEINHDVQWDVYDAINYKKNEFIMLHIQNITYFGIEYPTGK